MRINKRKYAAFVFILPIIVLVCVLWVPMIPVAFAISSLNDWEFGKEDILFPLYFLGVLK